ncbi:MAG: RNA polymerase sigma factor for flagellar operon FliA [Gammaproteobacteria bacterium]|jgi:RNA polymerase sigma factor for flagellar operon FliA
MNGQAMYVDVQRGTDELDVGTYAPLVKRIAFHLHSRLPPSVQVEDLIQAGMIGLLEAMSNFDATQGASFETYAGIRIRGSMLDEIRVGDWTPRAVRRQNRELVKAIKQVENRKGREASDAEVAEAMGLSIVEYHKMVGDAAGSRLFSLDDDRVSGDWHSNIVAEGDGPQGAFEGDFFKRAVADAIKELPKREQMVMALYYDEELTLKEVGAVLELSESRVCQIHGQALLRLRARLGHWVNDE